MSLYRSLTEEQRNTMLDNGELNGQPPSQVSRGVSARQSSSTRTPTAVGGNEVQAVAGGHTNSLYRHEGGAAGGDVTITNRNTKRYEKNSEYFAYDKVPKAKASVKFKPNKTGKQHYQPGIPPTAEVGKNKPWLNKPKGEHAYIPNWKDYYHGNKMRLNNYPTHFEPEPPVRKPVPSVGGNSNSGGLKFNSSLSAAPSNLPHSSSSSCNGIEKPRQGFRSREEMLEAFKSQMCPNLMAQPPTIPKKSMEPLKSIVANGSRDLKPSSSGTTDSIRKAISPINSNIEDDNGNENLISVNGISESLGSLSIGFASKELPPKSNGFKYQTDIDSIFATNYRIDHQPIAPVKMTHSVNLNMATVPSNNDENNRNATPAGALDTALTSIPIPQSTQAPSLVTTKTAQVENSSSSSTASNEGLGVTQTLKELLEQHRQKRELAKSQQISEEQKKAKPKAEKPLFNKSKVPLHILEQTRNLPIFFKKDELLDLVRKNQFIIVIGDTGSGKSTQIPQYLAEAGLHRNAKIGVTQPRRVAAKSLADRVALESGVKVGTAVGYAVRFDKKISGGTVIKYMTDGLLVKECATEANLDTYSIIIIDEAHERSIHTDVCFGLLKRATRKRPDLKVIISSATLDENKFAKYFNAPVFNVSGKGYKVDITYNPKTEYDYMFGAVDTIIDINRREPRGDILVFLSGQEEIEQCWDLLLAKLGQIGRSLYDEIIIIPCYGSLPFVEQQKIFEKTPDNARKVVLATNIAETSLTIEGIVYVIDCGFFKQNQYNAKSGIYSLVKKRITKFQAIQRAGRAGRTRAGKCVRLYSEREFNRMKDATSPEITRCNVESVILDIISMGIPNPLEFDFMDMPPKEAMAEAIEHLQELGALDDNLELTDLGRRMSEFPLEPSLSKVVLESEKLSCSDDVLKIVALLSTQYPNLFSRSKRDRQASDMERAKFSSSDGDLISLLAVYNGWLNYNQSEEWCQSRHIQYRILAEAEEIRQQLKEILSKRRISSYNRGVGVLAATTSLNERIRRAFTAGYFRQLAKKKIIGHAYQVLGDSSAIEDAYLHPSSSLFNHKHQWVIYHEVMKTSKTFMRGVIAVDPSWITEYAPMFAKKVAVHGVPMKA